MGRIVLYRLPICDHLAAHAEREELSVRGLAARLEVTPTTVSAWLRGVTTPSLDARLQRRLATELRVSPRRVLELFDLDLSDALVDGSASQRGRAGGNGAADDPAADTGDGGEQP